MRWNINNFENINKKFIVDPTLLSFPVIYMVKVACCNCDLTSIGALTASFPYTVLTKSGGLPSKRIARSMNPAENVNISLHYPNIYIKWNINNFE